ncbi:MAG TPA: glycoside hydrolase family 73 protein [Tetragenococcus sp.]|nr:glycoside hydrolase family 73 protein [Tetragenococcus sp.]
MAKKRKKKQKTPAVIAGLILILCGFVFSLISLSDVNLPGIALQHKEEKNISKEEFVDRLLPHAKELQDGYGILPSIILGQAILESNWGQSQLAKDYNNLFGVKAYGKQKKVKLNTKEYYNEQWITIKGEFRVYDSWEDSMDDHTALFVNGVDWNPQKYETVLTAQNYEEAADALQEAGYATDPDYAQKIKSVIKEHKLYKYD